MKDIKKILGTTLTASLATGIVGSVGTIAGAATIDEIYKAAYDATINALANKDQDSINAARVAIDRLPSEFQAFKGEFSKQVDTVQHPILVKIVNAINNADATGKQADINAARMTIPAGLPTVWRNSYSSGVDRIQQKLITNAVNAANAAVKSGSKADVDNARTLLSEIATVENNQGVKDWVSTYSTQFLKDVTLGVDTVDVLSNDTIRVNFIKEVDASTVTNTSFATYLTSTKASVGIASVKVSEDKKSVEVKLSSEVTEGKGYTVEVSGIKDLSGKTMAKDSATFEYAKADIATVTISKTKIGIGEDLKKLTVVKDTLGRDITSNVTLSFEVSDTSIITSDGYSKANGDVVVTPVIKDADGNVLLRGDKVAMSVSNANPKDYEGYTVYKGTSLPGDVYSKASISVDATMLPELKTQTANDVYSIALFYKDGAGNELQAFSPTAGSPIVVENKTPGVALLDPNTGNLTLVSSGTAYFKITRGDVVRTISVNVNAAPKPMSMTLDKTSVLAANGSSIAQEVKLELKDQYGKIFDEDGTTTIRYQIKNASGAFVPATDAETVRYAEIASSDTKTTDGKATIRLAPGTKNGTNTYRVIYEHKKSDGTIDQTLTQDFTVTVQDKAAVAGYDAQTISSLDLYDDPITAKHETYDTFSVYNLDANGARTGQVTGLDAVGGGNDANKLSVKITDKNGKEVYNTNTANPATDSFVLTEPSAGTYKLEVVTNASPDLRTAYTPDTGDYNVTVKVGDTTVKTYTLTVTDSAVTAKTAAFKSTNITEASYGLTNNIKDLVNLYDQSGKGIILAAGDTVVADVASTTVANVKTGISYDQVISKIRVTFADPSKKDATITLPTPVVITVNTPAAAAPKTVAFTATTIADATYVEATKTITSIVNLKDQFGNAITLAPGDVVTADVPSTTKINDTPASYQQVISKVTITYAGGVKAPATITLQTPVTLTVTK